MGKIANLLGRRRRARMEEDLHRELRYHFDRRVEDMRAAGIAEGEARRRVAIEMGGIDQVQEDVRETWTWRWIEDAIRDARYAARSLARSPGFTATAVLSLAIGVGASAAIFSLVDQVLFRLLPVREPERLVAVDWNGNSLSYGWGPGAYMSYPLCRDLMKQDRFFDGVLCRFPTGVMLASAQGRQAEPVGAEIVSGSYFPVLGVVPAMGRHLDEQDDLQPGAHPVVVLSHAYWQTALGGAPDVVGRKVLLNGFPMTVVGVASPRFRGMDIGEAPAVWIPASMKAQATPEWDRLLDRRAGFMQVFGRLRPGVGADEAQAGLLPWFKTMLDEDMRREGFPRVTAEQRAQFLASTITVRPAPLGRSNFRQRMDRPLVVLMAATLFLLLLASLNVASLSLARAAARSREIRTRIALGASRVRIATLLLADSLLVALAGGSLGLVVAPLVSRSLLSFLPPEAAGVGLSPAMDGRVFVFAFLVSAVAGVSCAMAPAWQAGRVSLIGSLNQRWSGGADMRARKALVVAQIAFTLTLLVGAGLFVQTLARLVGQGPGFETAHVVTFGLNLKRVGYSQENAQRATQRILAELRSLPQVAGLGVAGNTLLQGENWSNFLTVEAGRRFVTDRPVDLNPVTPGFFATLGTRVIAGRDFDGRDVRPAGETGGPRSAVVNESFARRYFPGGSPVGARLGLGDQADARADMEVVGVVRDFSYRNLREKTEQAFLPLFEGTLSGGWFYLRVRGVPEPSLAPVRTAVARVDPAVPLMGLRTFDDQVARSLTTERMLATLSTGFAASALLLSVVGLCGVMAFVVTRRTTEIGVRMALGATRGRAVSLVVAEAAAMIAVGTALALPCIWAAGRVVEAQLYGVTAIDAPTIAAASLLLTLVALAAAMLPAWRAASISPTEALRFE